MIELIRHALHQLVAPLTMAACAIGTSAAVVNFDELALAPETAWNGPDPHGVREVGLYGWETVGHYTSRGVGFRNRSLEDSPSWSGFGYSNHTDTTTPGFGNQFSAATGGGRESDQYGIAAGHLDAVPSCQQAFAFDPTNPLHLALLPTIDLPEGASLRSVAITNTTYAALSMAQGDSFAKAFGGPSGNDPDWFRVTAYGVDEAGTLLNATAEFYLADFRSSDNADDYLLSDWAEWDLSALADARSIHFNLSSSDVGVCGMNTPAYFAIDDLVFDSAALPGDYNGDGSIDAADYTRWRDDFGSDVTPPGTLADGDASGRVDEGDFALWRDHYGTTSGGTAVVPEPSAATLFVVACILFGQSRLARLFPSVSPLWNYDS